jgi:PAS domain S-box-containing protein
MLNAAFIRACKTAARVAAVVVLAVGIMSFAGWLLDAEALKTVLSGGVTIKANAAVCLVLVGTALLLLAPDGRQLHWNLAGRVLACVAMGIGGATLAEHLTGHDFGIDQLLFHEPPGAAATASPGRMGPPASTSFLLSGMALLLLDVKTKGGRVPAQWLAMLVGLIALIPLIGYAYDIHSLYGISKYTGIAAHTALAIFLVAVGLLTVRPSSGLMAVISSDDAGGMMARRLIVPTILIPFALGWLRTLGQRHGWFDEAFGRPMLILTLIVSFTALLWWNARSLSLLGRERQRAEEELRRSQRELTDFVENATVGMHWVGPGGTILWANRAELELLGYSKEEYVGRSIADFHADRPVIEDILCRLSNRQTLDEYEARLRCKDGSVRHVLINSNVLWDDGEFVHTRCFTRDVTERKQAEEALQQSEERFRASFDQAAVGIAHVGLDGRWLRVNQKLCDIVGYSREELIRLTFQEITHPDDLREDLDHLRRLVAGEVRTYAVEKRYVRKDGRTVWSNLTVSLVGSSTGPNPAYFVSVVEDIAARKQAEEALRRAKDEAERANEAKSEFLATLSHELRTPLTPVLLTVSLMESHPGLPDDLRSDVGVIRRNVELESRLISDLLDLTRIERGKLNLDEQDVDLHLIVRSAIDICQREASAKLDVDLSATRHVVRGDGTRLQQIFWNLISNAQKFSPPDLPIIVRTCDAPNGRVRVEVIDRGVGIDADVLPKLFNAFEQGNVRASRQQAGLGLGLAISKKLAEAHGGTISVRSEGQGHGATFEVELPALDVLARPGRAPQATSPNAQPITAPRHVLLVEDNEPTLATLAKLLRRMGHRVTTATTVASAMAAVRQASFDLIISDLGLPDGSGLDVMRQLGNEYEGRAIALTGYGMESDVAASREAGFAEHLTKPVDSARLNAAIRAVSGS